MQAALFLCALVTTPPLPPQSNSMLPYYKARVSMTDKLSNVTSGMTSQEVAFWVGEPSLKLYPKKEYSPEPYEIWRYEYQTTEGPIRIGEVWFDLDFRVTRMAGKIPISKDLVDISGITPELIAILQRTNGFQSSFKSAQYLRIAYRALVRLDGHTAAVVLRELSFLDEVYQYPWLMGVSGAIFDQEVSNINNVGRVEVLALSLLTPSQVETLMIGYPGINRPQPSLVVIDNTPLILTAYIMQANTRDFVDQFILAVERNRDGRDVTDDYIPSRTLKSFERWLESLNMEPNPYNPNHTTEWKSSVRQLVRRQLFERKQIGSTTL